MDTIDPQKFQKLQRQMEDLQEEVSRAEGAKSVLLKTLKQEHKCSSLKEAESKLEDVAANARTAGKKYLRLLKQFEKDHDL